MIAEIIVKLCYPQVGIPAAPVISWAVCVTEEEEWPVIGAKRLIPIVVGGPGHVPSVHSAPFQPGGRHADIG